MEGRKCIVMTKVSDLIKSSLRLALRSKVVVEPAHACACFCVAFVVSRPSMSFFLVEEKRPVMLQASSARISCQRQLQCVHLCTVESEKDAD